jgi:hypothetical protein
MVILAGYDFFRSKKDSYSYILFPLAIYFPINYFMQRVGGLKTVAHAGGVQWLH